MAQVRIQHTVRDYDSWRRMFDDDPLDRAASGVRHLTVSRAVDDPTLVFIDLDFDTVEQAQDMLARLERLWAGPAAGTLAEVHGTVVQTVTSTTP